jgi:hypothetical protein
MMKTNVFWVGAVCLLSLLTCKTAASTDFLLLGVSKEQSAIQTNNGTPAVNPKFKFQIFSATTDDAFINSFSVRLPNSQSITVNNGGEGWSYEAQTNSLSALNAQFPSGAYQFTVTTVHDGTHTFSIQLANDLYTPVPRLANFDAAQMINPQLDFQVLWDPFSNGTANDFIQFRIRDELGNNVFTSGEMPGVPGALNGTATGIIVPHGQLQANHSYQGELMFFKDVSADATSYPGALAIAGYINKTKFPVATANSDIRVLGVLKAQAGEQTSNSGPVAKPGFQFQIFADTDDDSLVTSISSRLPNSQTLTVPYSSENGWSYRSQASTMGALNTQFPDGAYQLTTVTRNNGSHTLSMQLAGDTYPPLPRIANFDALQIVDTHSDCTVNWDAFTGGTANDYIQLRVSDDQDNDVFTSGEIARDPVYLDGRATGTVIPAGILESGRTYYCQLMFVKAVTLDRNSYPGTLAIAGYFKRTDFVLQTLLRDVKALGLTKYQSAEQTSSGSPVVDPRYFFQTRVDIDSDWFDTINNVSLHLPNNQDLTLISEPVSNWYYQTNRPDQNALNTLFPNGDYTLSITSAGNLVRTITMNLTGDAYPPAPHIANYDAAQSVSINQDFRITWDRWTAGTANDFIQFEVMDDQENTIYGSGNMPGDPGFLDGTATGFNIPMGTLESNHSYRGRIMFFKATGDYRNSWPGAMGYAGYYRETTFTLKTAPINVSLIRVLKYQTALQSDNNSPMLAPGGWFYVNVTGDNPAVISSATVRSPLNQSYNLGMGAIGWTYRTNITDQTQLNTWFPDGNYTVSLTTPISGTHSDTVNLSGNLYPPLPRISNFDAAQNINPQQDFWVSWDSFTDGTANDFMQFQLFESNGNVVFASGNYHNSPDALHITDTSIRIPGYTMQTGHSYYGVLMFAKGTPAAATGYPGAYTWVGYSRFTRFSLGIQTADISDIGISLWTSYTQGSTGAPTLLGDRPYSFQAYVNGNVDNAYLRLPNDQIKTLDVYGNAASWHEPFASVADRNAQFPFGNYQFNISSPNNGLNTATVNFTDPGTLPALHISNYSQLIAMDPTKDFTLTWDATSGSNGAMIFLDIDDAMGNRILSTPGWPWLSDTNTSIVIPANTLTLGNSYRLVLNYTRNTQGTQNGYPGVSFNIGTYATTEVNVTPGATSIVVKSDANTLGAALGWGTPLPSQLSQLDQANIFGLTFSPVLVGPYGTTTSVPPNAPSGTKVINLPPGDGENGFFQVTFNLPTGFTQPRISGQATMDDKTRVFLNGTPITESMNTQNYDARSVIFNSTDSTLFHAGQNTLIFADANTQGGPSGGFFYAAITYVPSQTIQPHLGTGFRLANGIYRGHIEGEANKLYTIQSSSNLVQWNDLIITNTPAAVFDFEDKQATNQPIRFYRIKF